MDPIVWAAGAAGYLGLLFVLVALAAKYGPRKDPPQTGLEHRMTQLELGLNALSSTVKEETQRANRHRARAEEAERRHRRQLEESGGFEYSGPELHAGDAGGGGAGGVPTLRENVDAAQPQDLTQLANVHQALLAQKLDRSRRVGK